MATNRPRFVVLTRDALTQLVDAQLKQAKVLAPVMGGAEDEHPLASLHDMSVVGALRMLRRVEWELPDEIIFVGVQIGVNKDGLPFYPTFDMEALLTLIDNETKRMQNAMKH